MSGQVTLETARLRLRPFEASDINDVLAYACDERFSRFLPLPQPYLLDDAREFVETAMATDWGRHPKFAIEHGGVVVGETSVMVRDDGVGSLGYGIAPNLWGQGLMTEAARAVLAWAFEKFALAKVWATADAENVASWHVLEKLGMQREAYFRSHRLLRGQRRDVVQYGLLRGELTPCG